MEGPAQLFLLRQARRSGLAAIRLLLIAEDRAVDPGYRRQLLRDAVRAARAAARQALRFLGQGGSVPAELRELRRPEERARRLALFRAQIRRQNLPLTPAADRGFERRREQVRERQRAGKSRAAARRRKASSSTVCGEPPAPRSEPAAILAEGLEPVKTLAAAAAKHGSRAGKLHLVVAERLKGAPQEVIRQYQDWILREVRQAAHLACQVLERGGLTAQEMAALRSPEGKAAHLASLRRRAGQMALPRFGREVPASTRRAQTLGASTALGPASSGYGIGKRRWASSRAVPVSDRARGDSMRRTASLEPPQPARGVAREVLPVRLPPSGDDELDQAFRLMETGVLRLKAVVGGLDALNQIERALWVFRLSVLGGADRLTGS
jgi:hypothetical protein